MQLHRLRTLCAALPLALIMAAAPGVFAEDGLPDEPGVKTPSEKAQARDAAIDRGFLTSHAETIGAKQWAINAYELVFLGVTYGFTNDIQMSLSTLLPVTTDIPLVLALQPKFVIARTPETVVALRVPFTYVKDTSGNGSSAGFLGAGLLVDHYFGPSGRIGLHAGLLVAGVFGDFDFDAGGDGDGLSLADGAAFELDLGASFGVSNSVKLILEGQIFAAAGDGGFEVADVVLINYGVRIHGSGLAGDLGFIRPIGIDTDPLLLGIPYVAISARF